MPAGLLPEPVHAVAKRVAMDTDLLGRVAPAAPRIEEGRQGAHQPIVVGSGTQDTVDECLERRIRKGQEELERPEVVVGRDRRGDGVERGPRLEQAPPERATS